MFSLNIELHTHVILYLYCSSFGWVGRGRRGGRHSESGSTECEQRTEGKSFQTFPFRSELSLSLTFPQSQSVRGNLRVLAVSPFCIWFLSLGNLQMLHVAFTNVSELCILKLGNFQ